MVEMIISELEGQACEAYLYPASNPQYLEICTDANIVQFEAMIEQFGIKVEGYGFLASNYKDWIIAWLEYP